MSTLLQVVAIYSALAVVAVLLVACGAEDDDGITLCMNCEHAPDRHHARREGGFIVWSCLTSNWNDDSCECDHYRPRVRIS